MRKNSWQKLELKWKSNKGFTINIPPRAKAAICGLGCSILVMIVMRPREKYPTLNKSKLGKAQELTVVPGIHQRRIYGLFNCE